MHSKGGDEIERELVDLRVVFKILRNKFPLVLIIAYATAWLSGIITIYLIPDTYKAKTELIIYNPDAPPSYLEENSAVFGTWRAMIKSVYMTNLVKKKLGPSIQTKEIEKKVAIKSSDNPSQVFSIEARNQDPKKAIRIANAIASVFKETTPNFTNVKVEDREPKLLLHVITGFLLGLVLSLIVVLLVGCLKSTKKMAESKQDPSGET